MSSEPGRLFEHAINIDAPPEVVWRAIADGDELKRWFPIDARVKPGVGGAIFLSWGPGCEGEAPITIWEPGRHLRWEEPHDGGAVTIAVDIFIEPSPGNATSVRLVQSGFGRGGKWDDMYDSISNGWKFELRSLAHYLGRHRGVDRAAAWLPVMSSLPASDAFARLASVGGLVTDGSLAGYQDDDAFRFTGPDGRRYSGVVLRAIPARSFVGTVSELDDAILRVECERSGTGSMPFVWLSIWGHKREQAATIAEQWRARIEELVLA